MGFDGFKLVRRRSLRWLPLAAMASGLLVGKLFAQCQTHIDVRIKVHQNVAGTLEHWYVPAALCDTEMNTISSCGDVATACTNGEVTLYRTNASAYCTGTAVDKWGMDNTATWNEMDWKILKKSGPCIIGS